jgi:hypothetical protein
MNEEDFNKYQGERYGKTIRWYDVHARHSFQAYSFLQWSLIILSALTPVLILIEDSNKWFAVAIAVLVAISSSALKTFKFQENWVRYRSCWHAMTREKAFYEAGIQGYGKVDDKEALFVERVESLVEREANEFVAMHDKKGQ